MIERDRIILFEFTNGKSMMSIAKEHGFSQPLVNKVLKRYGRGAKDGGVYTRGLLRVTKRRKFVAGWGCTFDQAMSLTSPEHRKGFHNHRFSAAQRGIDFDFTLIGWVLFWEQSGKWEKRGIHKGCFVMARKGDIGPYRADNVEIITNAENVAQMFENRGIKCSKSKN